MNVGLEVIEQFRQRSIKWNRIFGSILDAAGEPALTHIFTGLYMAITAVEVANDGLSSEEKRDKIISLVELLIDNVQEAKASLGIVTK